MIYLCGAHGAGVGQNDEDGDGDNDNLIIPEDIKARTPVLAFAVYAYACVDTICVQMYSVSVTMQGKDFGWVIRTHLDHVGTVLRIYAKTLLMLLPTTTTTTTTLMTMSSAHTHANTLFARTRIHTLLHTVCAVHAPTTTCERTLHVCAHARNDIMMTMVHNLKKTNPVQQKEEVSQRGESLMLIVGGKYC